MALKNRDEKKLYQILLDEMKNHLVEAEYNFDDVVNAFGIGQVNTTLLAEEIAYASSAIEDPNSALDDETHVIWDAVIDAADWFESNYRGPLT